MSKVITNTTEKTGRKIGLNTLISWGASVVIIGLTFKLLHWDGGEWMIGVGLSVEALLFFLLGINAMNAPEDTKTTVVETVPSRASTDLDDLLNKSINPATLQRLSQGFDQFNKTVESVNQVVGYTTVTKSMVTEVENATRELMTLRASLEELNKVYKAQIEAFRKS